MHFFRIYELALSLLTLPAFADKIFYKSYLYKHSFFRPQLALPDGRIAFWELEGDAMAGPEQLRLAPSVRSRRGAAWNVRPMTEAPWWIVDLAFQIKGPGKLGADGMAFWYTAQRGRLGPVFGSNDQWNGLGIFFDSYDNDGKGNNPLVGAMVNDGTKMYDHGSDGAQQLFASCRIDYRNRPYPTNVRIEYRDNNLFVHITDGLSPQSPLQMCISASNVFLPANGFFGVSAATGGMADDHDVVGFRAYGLNTEPPKRAAPTETVDPNANLAKQEEFQKRLKEYEEQRKQYRIRFPSAKPAVPDDEEEETVEEEDSARRYLRLVLESQSTLRTTISRYEETLNRLAVDMKSVLNIVSAAGGTISGTGQASLPRQDVDQILQSTRNAHAAAMDQQSALQQLVAKVNQIEVSIQTISRGGAPPSGGDHFFVSTIKPYLEALKKDIEAFGYARSSGSAGQCLSMSTLVVALGVQSVVLIITIFVRSRSDKVKFY